MYILGITGHSNIEQANLIKINNYEKYDEALFKQVYKEIHHMVNKILIKKNLKIKDLVFISGMARGVDEIFAIKNNIPIIASIPNSLQWHKNRGVRKNGVRAQAIYYDKIIQYIQTKIKNKCNYSKILEIKKQYNNKEYKYANFARNQHIIDTSDGIISYFKYNSVGTKDAIKKAKQANKYLGNINNFDNNKNLLFPLNIKYNTDIFKEKTNVLIHGCNCFNTMGAGVAKQIKKLYPKAYEEDKKTKKGDKNKLGTFTFIKTEDKYIVNAYTQYTYWDSKDMFDIKSFSKSLEDIILYFLKKRKNNTKIMFSLPAIGLGLANGKIEEIYEVLVKTSKKFENKNIEIKVCLQKKDKKIKENFKKLEEENTNKKLKINYSLRKQMI